MPDPHVKPIGREAIAARVNLSGIEPRLAGRAIDGLVDRNGHRFICCCNDNMNGLAIVWRNYDLLQSLGIFESTLLHAYPQVRVNTRHVPAWAVEWLFRMADRERLRAAGEPIPGSGPFVLFRAVAGRGPARRLRGVSWTSSETVARWFAKRAAIMGLALPTVYRTNVPLEDVLAYTNERKEEEFLVLVSPTAKLERLKDSGGEA